MISTHQPVLLEEVLSGLRLKSGDTVIDGTAGLGGHASAVWERIAPNGRLLAIDRDERNLAMARTRLAQGGNHITCVQGSYADANRIASQQGIGAVNGILLDLGYASTHVDDATRGFSFQQEGPLDMRYDVQGALTAEIVVNSSTERELTDLFRRYGEEPQAARLAKAICVERKKERFITTTQLADFIARIMPRRGRIHPATKVFQALRIVVNDELGELERALPLLVSLLAPGGRLAIISFHSLEDRLVKQFIKAQAGTGVGENITKHVITPSLEEIRNNPRARSAKLRIFEMYDRSHAHNKAGRHRAGDG